MPSSPSIKGGPVSYDFAYDDLYQLIAADGTYRTAPNKTERFDLALSYDAIHNITEKVQRAGSVKRGGPCLVQPWCLEVTPLSAEEGSFTFRQFCAAAETGTFCLAKRLDHHMFAP